MRIVFAGTPEVALPSLEALLESDHEVVAVLTRPDAPSGRGKKLTPSPVAERAAELGIETLKPARPREPEFLARLAEIGLTQVEPYAFHTRTAEFKAAFTAAGVSAPSGHAAVIDAELAAS